MIIVVPDPKPIPLKLYSPRKNVVDFLVQFGWYLDATEPPYNEQYRMYSYFIEELIPLIDSAFPTIPEMRGISGHSMGGHGALVLGLREFQLFKSISCLAPQCAASKFLEIYDKYFGPLKELEGKKYDASQCIRNYDGPHRLILADQVGHALD